ncbi:MAG: PilZ domain-containing protein [Deltaproteobacteria bacterium]|nr:PilZ domain-containing protein [Deltaproteobacteria bacterium]
MEKEGRQHQRGNVSWSVTIQTEEGTIERATYNISPDGAFIRGLSPLELHEVVDMTLSGPDHPITVKAKVVWSSSQVPPKEDMPRGVGVEFINISDEDREIISSFVAGLDFAMYLESPTSDEDAKVQSLIKEQSLIQEQILIEEQAVEEEKEDMKKPTLGPPKKCPDGHRHISWSMGDDHIFCWDCNQRYPLLACFQPPESSLSESGTHLKEEEAEK